MSFVIVGACGWAMGAELGSAIQRIGPKAYVATTCPELIENCTNPSLTSRVKSHLTRAGRSTGRFRFRMGWRTPKQLYPILFPESTRWHRHRHAQPRLIYLVTNPLGALFLICAYVLAAVSCISVHVRMIASLACDKKRDELQVPLDHH